MSIESVMLSNHLILCRLFSSYPQSLPTSKSFPMSQLFASGGQTIGVSASVSVLPMNIQGWFSLGFTGLLSLLSKGLSRVFSTIKSINSSALSLFYGPLLTSVQDYWKKNPIALTIQTFVSKVMSLFAIAFNTLFLSFQYAACHSFPSKEAFNFMAAVTVCCDFGTQENKTCHCFHFFSLLFAIKGLDQMPWF